MSKEAVTGAVQEAATIRILQKMVQTNTVNPPGNEKQLAQWIADELARAGIDVEFRDMGDNRANVIGRIKGTGERKALLFDGHLDTVPPGKWTEDPWGGIIKEGRLYGLGTSDMKGGLAAMMQVLLAVKASGVVLKGDLILAASIDEETDSLGAWDLLKSGGLDDVGAIVIGEPNYNEITICEKGALWLKVTLHGKTAHGAMPEKGINAIVHMNAFLNELLACQFAYEENPLLGKPTMNIATLHGGLKTNVVPDQCELTLDIRTVPGQSHAAILDQLQGICRKLQQDVPGFSAQIEVISDRAPVETKGTDPFVALCRSIHDKVTGRTTAPNGFMCYTDAAVFLPHTDIPLIVYGPGEQHMAHQPDEYIELDRLHEATRFYAELVQTYLVD